MRGTCLIGIVDRRYWIFRGVVMSRPRKKISASTSNRATSTAPTESYRHPTAESPLRPEVGTQAQFRKKKPPVTYRYDSSLSPALDWDRQNPAREQGEALIARLEQHIAELRAALEQHPATKGGKFPSPPGGG